ncbi:hypothetical protein BDQ12DRAFT_677655 [Crucibulum laeve]|uniref:Uncharacterized protein n=1 Tax=Crucibulum laeve TaxID=68775 RepID=A0A5C3MBT5_9AGAR|nr:hypothetical protein BDQ12DRAFT_677655 [Crucibulum laeve]
MAHFSSRTSWRRFSKATENRSQAAGGVSGSNVQGSDNGLKPLDSKPNGSSPRANSSPMGEPVASSAARSPTSDKASNDNSANGSIQKSSLEQSSSHMPPPLSKPTQSTKEGPSSVVTTTLVLTRVHSMVDKKM